MIIGLENVIAAGELPALRARIAAGRFADGKSSAGWYARDVKQNTQLSIDDPGGAEIIATLDAALKKHPLFMPAVHPKSLRLMVNRYRVGDSYGRHVDDAYMGLQRTDIAMTLFLSDPKDYDGGELVIDLPSGEQRMKLPAGAAIVYPATTIHRVEPVTRGERLACVGWIESRLRDPGQREIIYDLERARRAMFAAGGKTREFDLISKSVANLLRRWGE
ncbi:MAG: Fe2+-dependent dioxygenase [Alphaproteobacteria bacterium]|nr:Fe2+-dependent dioxygenase [Alphaproteobacteria bacterium]